MPNLAYLSLGSNILPEKNLPAAVRALTGFGKVLAVSNVWETPPVGCVDQPNFLNAAVLLETPEPPETFHARVIRPLEHRLDRVRTENPNAPRTIDLDLSLFNDQILSLGHHHIPDPDILTRAFVAIPLAEIAPTYRHPETGQSLAEIAATFTAEKATMHQRAEVQLAWKRG
ncbi:MAG: 2-amino-4-hydroxy-6-hydroxymethyldihydropteridine diphosphokinase [Anaerolineales bacterium]|nr:2-amino-4-hydroxy-6-hydroxymethyldihydropteridine diphosphokinase [Anaerolineales bacterium]